VGRSRVEIQARLSYPFARQHSHSLTQSTLSVELAVGGASVAERTDKSQPFVFEVFVCVCVCVCVCGLCVCVCVCVCECVCGLCVCVCV
jgi:hypothetical protein